MPRYGFNFQWMFSTQQNSQPQPPDERALDFLAEYGFDFVRLPLDYGFWTKDFDYFHPDEAIFVYLDRYLAACRARGLHLCLNLHRAPGYCINGNELEQHNLWLDPMAQDAFVFLWETFTRRYAEVPNDCLSFDLINEPPDIDQYGMTRDKHAALMRRAIAAIRAITPDREIVLDGLGGGNLAMPELADAGVVHSGRGYQPMPISHYRATWWSDHAQAPEPKYPGLEWEGYVWNRDTLHAFYQPWRDVEAQGVRIHIGEFGCFDQTPLDIAQRWFVDLLSVFQEFKWGYSLWNFAGPFGIIGHGRAGTHFEERRGYQVDRVLLDLLLNHRIK